MAKISVQPQNPADWTRLIAELDEAIEDYCAAHGVSDERKH